MVYIYIWVKWDRMDMEDRARVKKRYRVRITLIPHVLSMGWPSSCAASRTPSHLISLNTRPFKGKQKVHKHVSRRVQRERPGSIIQRLEPKQLCCMCARTTRGPGDDDGGNFSSRNPRSRGIPKTRSI